MEGKILVTYASKYGATAEIAERIGQELRAAGLHVDVLPVKQVADPAMYHAVVLGSAVYIGRWRKEAASFLKDHERALSERPVWLFSSGPSGAGDPADLLKGWRFPPALQPIADRIQPRDIAVFHGNVDRDRMSLIHKWMINKVKAPMGDFRNWDMIASWARGVAEALKEPAA